MLDPMIYPGKYGGLLSTGSRDIVGTRICHTNADADAVTEAHTNGIRTETTMSPSPLVGGHKYLQTVLMLQSGHEYVEEMAKFQSSKDNNSKSMQSRVTVPALCTSSHGVLIFM